MPIESGYTPGNVIKGLVGPWPIPVLNYYSSAAESYLANLLSKQDFDAIHVHGLQLFKYVRAIHLGSKARVLFDWHNIESELMRRYALQTHNLPKKLAALRTADLLHATEREMLKGPYAHAVVSERDREALLTVAPQAQTHVIGNGVDTEYFGPEALAKFRLSSEPTRKTLLFVGSMDYHANIGAVTWFVREVWPTLSRDFPQIDFTIAGRSPGPSIRALASDRVHVTGTLSDVRSVYAGAFAVVVPLRVGGGTRLKILEAMAGGVPVISTRLGAEGLAVQDRKHLLVAESVADFRDAVAQLLSNSSLRSSLIENASSLVSDKYDWRAIGTRLSDVYLRLK